MKLDIYEVVRSNAPSIEGTATFNQYLSIRTSERTSGTITFANHIAAWSSLGMVSQRILLLSKYTMNLTPFSLLQTLGTYNYQIMATEGYESAGSSSMTITSST